MGKNVSKSPAIFIFHTGTSIFLYELWAVGWHYLAYFKVFRYYIPIWFRSNLVQSKHLRNSKKLIEISEQPAKIHRDTIRVSANCTAWDDCLAEKLTVFYCEGTNQLVG